MRVLLLELKRSVVNVRTLIAAATLALAGFLGGYSTMVKVMDGYLTGMGELYLQTAYAAFCSDAFVLMVPVVCTLPYSSMFAVELKSRFLRAYLPRARTLPYLTSRTAATLASGGASVLLGCGLLVAVYALIFPPTGEAMSMYAMPPIMAVSRIWLAGLSGCLWAVVGGISAAATMNRYMAYALPFILFYVLSAFRQRYFTGLTWLDPAQWMSAEALGLGTSAMIQAGVILAGCVAFTLLMKRRLRDV